MSQPPSARSVYPIDGHSYNINEILANFASAVDEAAGHLRVSDLHLVIGEPLRYRMDGDLHAVNGPALDEPTFRALIEPLITPEQFKQFAESGNQDLDASSEPEGLNFSLRLNLFRDRRGSAAVLRFIPRNVIAVEKIGFPTPATWQEIVELKQGLVIFTGITGSGKSTTLFSLLQRINESRRVRAITLEDPIEYRLSNAKALVSQREIGRHVVSFPYGLRSALREDPDVIVVGEIRDQETAELALNAAETGHLVLTSLHSKEARGAVSRLLGFFPSEAGKEVLAQISLAVSHVVAQKLVPRADGKGRVLAMEVMRMTSALANQIRLGKMEQISSAIETGSKNGMISMEKRLSDLAAQKIITRDDALAFSNDPLIMEKYLGPAKP